MFALEIIAERTIADTDLGVATSAVPMGYDGPCRVTCQGRTTTALVLPCVIHAEHAARFAIGYLGGYHSAHIEAAPDQAVTHESWDLWAFEF